MFELLRIVDNPDINPIRLINIFIPEARRPVRLVWCEGLFRGAENVKVLELVRLQLILERRQLLKTKTLILLKNCNALVLIKSFFPIFS
jgi:hypothetical protein